MQPTGPYTNFDGLATYGVPVIGLAQGLPLAPKYWFVSSNTTDSGKPLGSAAGDGSYSRPLASITGALAKCVDSRGDCIVVMDGYTETLAAAAGIAIDKIGVTIVGLGVGNRRPTINLGTATTATVTVTAANVTIKNIRFLSTFADVVTAINLTAAGFSCLYCDFGDSAVDLNLLSAIKATSTTDGNANDFQAIGNTFLSQDAATLAFVIFTADVLKVKIEDNIIVNEGTGLATIFTCATGKDIRMASVRRNVLSSKATAGNLGYSNDTASPNNSGVIADNYIGHADVTGAMALGVVGGCRMFNNLTVSTDALSGFVIPAIDVDL
jgi:hypothetical protein